MNGRSWLKKGGLGSVSVLVCIEIHCEFNLEFNFRRRERFRMRQSYSPCRAKFSTSSMVHARLPNGKPISITGLTAFSAGKGRLRNKINIF